MGNEGILEEERQEHSPRDRHMPENQGSWSGIVGHRAREGPAFSRRHLHCTRNYIHLNLFELSRVHGFQTLVAAQAAKKGGPILKLKLQYSGYLI